MESASTPNDALVDAFVGLASALRNVGEHRPARQLARWAARYFPDSPIPNLTLGVLSLDESHPSLARNYFQAVLNAEDLDSGVRHAALLGIAKTYIAESNHVEAIHILNEAVQDGLTRPDLMLMLIECCTALGMANEYGNRVSEAASPSDPSVDAGPDLTVSHGWIPQLAEAIGSRDFHRAIEIIEDRTDKQEMRAELLLMKAHLEGRAGNVEEALGIYDQLAARGDLGPHQAAFLQLGTVSAAGDFTLAQEIAEHLISRFPVLAAPHLLRANLMLRMTPPKFREALDSINQAINLDETDPSAYRQRAELYVASGKLNEAIADLDQALRLQPNESWTRVMRGDAFRLLGDFKRALSDFDSALQDDPSDSVVLGLRGEVFRELRDFDAAYEDLSKAIDLDPGDPWLLGRRGELYRQRGDYQSALQDFDRALDIDPADRWARGSRAQVFIALDMIPEALADAEAACASENGGDAGPWTFLVRAEARLLVGDTQGAFSDLATQPSPDEADWWHYLRAIALKQMQNDARAIEEIEQAMKHLADADELERGLYFVFAGERSEAVQAFQRALDKADAADERNTNTDLDDMITHLRHLSRMVPSIDVDEFVAQLSRVSLEPEPEPAAAGG